LTWSKTALTTVALPEPGGPNNCNKTGGAGFSEPLALRSGASASSISLTLLCTTGTAAEPAAEAAAWPGAGAGAWPGEAVSRVFLFFPRSCSLSWDCRSSEIVLQHSVTRLMSRGRLARTQQQHCYDRTCFDADETPSPGTDNRQK